MIDFTQLGLNILPKQINPRDIFMGLANKSEKYQYPRDVQGEVWKQWFDQRNNKDTIKWLRMQLVECLKIFSLRIVHLVNK